MPNYNPDKTTDQAVAMFKNFVDSLDDFEITMPDVPYNQLGATITDAILHAGLKWSSVVEPRLKKLRNNYPEANTTAAFCGLIEKPGINELLNWKDSDKLDRIMRLTTHFISEGVENELDMKAWLENESNVAKLRRIKC